MTRVGFVMGHTDFSWVGGLNYLRTLIAAVQALPQRDIEPVLLMSPEVPDHIRDSFPGTLKIVGPTLASTRPRRVLRKASRLLLGVDWPLEVLLRRNDIKVISHSWHLDHSSNVRTVEWIPDFQHRHLPEFFSPKEVRSRDRNYRKTAENCSALVLSSNSALEDLRILYAPAIAKSHVLHFVAHPDAAASRTPMNNLASKYGIEGAYFHLPNQFWAHKNHRVVIDALVALKDSGRPVQVFCTGYTGDIKRPAYFNELMAYVTACGVDDCFRVLGMIPTADMYGLMQNAVAVINPSHFEGWSSTVEESKALGKIVILSDLPVHREQAPPRGLFFDADNVEMLAAHMLAALDSFDSRIELQEQVTASARHRERFLTLGRDYQLIVQAALR